ncbi:MAG: sugar phosphate isomerase/epimerase [Planctomycetes bacterium]|nr:sugar phosphate isomerase/epimerase [Planctomycetota bacterium]
MVYSGFADEAGSSIDIQIQATQTLGWSAIEARNIDGINLTDISDEEFELVCQKLDESGVRIDCFGSAVANWGKDARDEEDFQRSIEELKRAIPRMQRLKTGLIRGMSFTIVKDEQPDSPEMEKMIIEKLRALVRLCEENGVTYLHENCSNFGGLSYQHTLKLLDRIDSPNFKLVFDTGNPVGMDNQIGQPPYTKQSSWEFYQNVKHAIQRVHIKDCIFIGESEGIFPERRHTFPGEGQGDVRRILKDLIESGYDQALSIEPHIAVVYHDASVSSTEEVQYANYVEYGQRLMKLTAEIRREI